MDRQINSVARGSDIGVEQEIENMGKRRSKDVSKKGDDDGSMNETFNLDEEEEEHEEDVISLANVYRQVHSHSILRIDAENGQNFIFSQAKSRSFTHCRNFAIHTSAHGFKWTVGCGKFYISTLWYVTCGRP